ncbi:hypothetical protein, conserved [Eimeria necatrix]|uniref:Transmembrane protein n=1 Tax=Eimeria necatrix TaxID=51315 RepID=U6MVR0_9EIME|nr:hypothetical protein, conserved [Eimeria necatrix]CDJ68362.1 hypothetical protein, conserved [Eimeria necatrix]
MAQSQPFGQPAFSTPSGRHGSGLSSVSSAQTAGKDVVNQVFRTRVRSICGHKKDSRAILFLVLPIVAIILACFRGRYRGTGGKNVPRRLATGPPQKEDDRELSDILDMCLEMEEERSFLPPAASHVAQTGFAERQGMPVRPQYEQSLQAAQAARPLLDGSIFQPHLPYSQLRLSTEAGIAQGQQGWLGASTEVFSGLYMGNPQIDSPGISSFPPADNNSYLSGLGNSAVPLSGGAVPYWGLGGPLAPKAPWAPSFVSQGESTNTLNPALASGPPCSLVPEGLTLNQPRPRPIRPLLPAPSSSSSTNETPQEGTTAPKKPPKRRSASILSQLAVPGKKRKGQRFLNKQLYGGVTPEGPVEFVVFAPPETQTSATESSVIQASAGLSGEASWSSKETSSGESEETAAPSTAQTTDAPCSDSQSELTESDPVSESFSALHPFYKLPVLEANAIVRKFCAVNAFGHTILLVHPSSALRFMQTSFAKQRINEREANGIIIESQRIVNHLFNFHRSAVPWRSASKAVLTLGLRYLMLDSLLCAIDLLGPAMDAPQWWTKLVKSIPTKIAIKDLRLQLNRSKHYALLAERLSAASEAIKRGLRPGARETVALKRDLFCTELSLPLFKKPQWDIWRYFHKLSCGGAPENFCG